MTTETRRTYTCPRCHETRDRDDVLEAPCLLCGVCAVCVPTAGGRGSSDLCRMCQPGSERREATVQLSGLHAGQGIELRARLEAEGTMVVVGRDGLGRPRRAWRLDRCRAVVTETDRSGPHTTERASPWVSSRREAEQWIMDAGIVVESTGAWSWR